MKQLHAHHRNAFTLVELAVVMAIIGMLVGGILMGSNMIHVGKLRSMVTDGDRYLGAVNHFRSQYKYLPGDLPTAATYWSATTSGNGDGRVNPSATTPSTPEERFYFWQQLNLAGFIEKSFPGAVAGSTFTPGTNVPAARLENGAFAFSYINNTTATTTNYAAAGNALIIGAISGTGPTIGALLKPEDAYTIDRKMDDGLPGAGKWLASSGTAFGATGCASANTAVATYSTANTAVSCSFYVLTGF